MQHLKLSILITTHDNEKEIARCLDSVLDQKINFPFEILVSDDSSTDGTMRILRKYEKEHKDILRIYTVCSDEVNPTMGLERAGWNKANVYMHAQGEYVVNLDGDDYLRATDIYQQQIQQLDMHPECVASMQDLWVVNNGEEKDTGWKWGQNDLKTGDIIDFNEYLVSNRVVSHPAFMFRRDVHTNVVKLYGKFFDDEFNVMHHINGGKIIYINRADYVYVQYGTSLNNSYEGFSRDVRFLCLPAIYTHFWPEYATSFFSGRLEDLQRYLRNILSNRKTVLRQDVLGYLSQFDGWIFQFFVNNQQNLLGYVRLWFIRHYILMLNTCKPSADWMYKLLIRSFM